MDQGRNLNPFESTRTYIHLTSDCSDACNIFSRNVSAKVSVEPLNEVPHDPAAHVSLSSVCNFQRTGHGKNATAQSSGKQAENPKSATRQNQAIKIPDKTNQAQSPIRPRETQNLLSNAVNDTPEVYLAYGRIRQPPAAPRPRCVGI